MAQSHHHPHHSRDFIVEDSSGGVSSTVHRRAVRVCGLCGPKGVQERTDDARMGHPSGRLGCVSTPLPKGGRFAPLSPPTAYMEPHPVPTLGAPIGGGLMGVHCHHPLHGVTGRTRITPAADLVALDHPTPPPPADLLGDAPESSSMACSSMTASRTATAASKNLAQGGKHPNLRKGALPIFQNFSGT